MDGWTNGRTCVLEDRRSRIWQMQSPKDICSSLEFCILFSSSFIPKPGRSIRPLLYELDHFLFFHSHTFNLSFYSFIHPSIILISLPRTRIIIIILVEKILFDDIWRASFAFKWINLFSFVSFSSLFLFIFFHFSIFAILSNF